MATTLEVDGLTTRLEELGLGPPPRFAEAHVLVNPLDIGRVYLADILSTLLECEPNFVYESIHWPNDIDTGDFTIPLKKLSKKSDPKELAVSIADKFPQGSLFQRPFREENAAHLRILFSPKTLVRLLLSYISDRKHEYGQDHSLGAIDPSASELNPKTVVIEFSSPNIGGEFHEKHLRSTLIGSFIANLYESMGWKVVRLNYLGDWGKNLGLLGAGWTKFGSEEEFKHDPVRHLLKVYNQMDELFQPELAASRAARDKREDTSSIESQGVFFERNEFFKRMESGDEQAIELWERFRNESIAYYDKQYSSLNIKFDAYSGESQVTPETMDEVEEQLKSKGISEESEGAWIVDLSKHKGGPSKALTGRAIIRDRNGSRTYQLRELAAAIERSRKYTFDKMIYVVANDHDLHFNRTIKILELLDMADLANKLQHIRFHKGSSTAEGAGYDHLLGDIIEKCTTALQGHLTAHPELLSIQDNSTEIVRDIGVSTLLVQELSIKNLSEHTFDVKRLTTSGRVAGGLELQIWYNRLVNLLPSNSVGVIDFSEGFDSLIEEEQYLDLLRILAEYPDVTALAWKSTEPQVITTYLATIIDQLERCFEEEEDGDEEETEKEKSDPEDPAKVALWDATRQVLENGMRLLGIKPLVLKTADV